MKFTGKIYVLCPAYYATGGTELLHQVVYKLNHLFQVPAFLYYVNVDWKFEVPPTPKRFVEYIGDSYVEEIEDNEANVLIIPENFSNHVFKFQHIRRVLWWLSVDNYFLQFDFHFQTASKTKKLKRSVRKAFNGFPYNQLQKLKKPSVVTLHLVQSQYAYDFLQANGFAPVAWLSDYINTTIAANDAAVEKKDQILYNPMKGKEFTESLMALAPDIRWIPLQKMTPQQIASLMAESKIYVDFGHHPGKDRIPREAALNGCIVITNRKGAAGNSKDLPIPNHYKFEENNRNKEHIVSKIRFCLANYASLKNDFAPYRERILAEEHIFEDELKAVLALL